MKKGLKLLARVALLLIVVASAIVFWKREELGRLLAVNTLFDEGRIVENFSNMDRAFLTAEIPTGAASATPLPAGPQTSLPQRVHAWIEDRDVTSLVVLKDGKIVFEDYFHGTTAEDRRVSWSLAKSFLSAIVGILHDRGVIPDLDIPVTKHAPLLAGSAYDGATLRDVLQMTSGVAFDEDYLDYNSDINRMGREIALGGSLDEFAANLEAVEHPPGEVWQYVSIDTHVVGMVVRGVTGRTIPDLMSEYIVQPLGMKHPPYYITDGDGTAFVLGGLNMTARDFARFGLLYANGGQFDGVQVVPEEWVEASATPSAPTPPGEMHYSLQWWMPSDRREGELMARGIYGQYIYIDRSKDVVIVTNGADRNFRQKGVQEENIDMFRLVSASL